MTIKITAHFIPGPMEFSQSDPLLCSTLTHSTRQLLAPLKDTTLCVWEVDVQTGGEFLLRCPQNMKSSREESLECNLCAFRNLDNVQGTI